MGDQSPVIGKIVTHLCEQRGWLLLGGRDHRVLRDLDRDGYIVRIAESPTWQPSEPYHRVFISALVVDELRDRQFDRAVSVVTAALDELERKLALPCIDIPLRWSPYPWSPHP